MRYTLTTGLLSGTLLFLIGCPAESFDSLAPATLAEIDRIRNDTTMPVPEMRSRLAELGLDPITINAVLWDKPLGNQFGGTLRTAYEKLTIPDFTALTPDEIQMFAAKATEVDDTLSLQFNDQQAQALSNMFRNNSLTSPADLTSYLDTPGNSVPTAVGVGDEDVRSLFVDFDLSLLLPELP